MVQKANTGGTGAPTGVHIVGIDGSMDDASVVLMSDLLLLEGSRGARAREFGLVGH